MNDKLIEFINSELKDRGWSERELARRARPKISNTSVNDVLNSRRDPTWDFLAAIAAPLGKTPLDMFVLAEKPLGIFGAVNEAKSPYVVADVGGEIAEIAGQLDEAGLSSWLDFGRYLAVRHLPPLADDLARDLKLAMERFNSDERQKLIQLVAGLLRE